MLMSRAARTGPRSVRGCPGSSAVLRCSSEPLRPSSGSARSSERWRAVNGHSQGWLWSWVPWVASGSGRASQIIGHVPSSDQQQVEPAVHRAVLPASLNENGKFASGW